MFGKEKKFTDNKIGILKSRIKNENPSINHTWTGESLLPDQKKKTVFILEGNFRGPYKNQLESVHRIIEGLNSIIQKIQIEINNNKPVKTQLSKDWIKGFYLAAITPMEIRETKFEVTFEPLNDKDTGYIGLIWENGKITEIEVK